SDPGDEQEPDARERVEKVAGVDLEICGGTVLREEIQVTGAAAQPGVNDLLKRLMVMSVGPCVVFENCAARKQECEDNDTHAYYADGLLGELAAKEKHDCGAEGRQQGDQVDVVQEEQFSFWLLASSFRLNAKSVADEALARSWRPGAGSCFFSTTSISSL